MGYWSSGTEWRDWEARWCDRCIHGADAEGGGCPVRLLHDQHSYDEQCHCIEPGGAECRCLPAPVQMRETLDLLVSKTKKTSPSGFVVFGNECRMFSRRPPGETRQQQVMREIRGAAEVGR